MATYTTHFNFYQPLEGDGIINGHTWGLQINDNFDAIDALLWSLSNNKMSTPEGGTEGQVIGKVGGVQAWMTLPSGLPPGGTLGQVVTRVEGGGAWADPPVGFPPGGTTHQIPRKVDNTDYNIEWADPPSGGGGSGTTWTHWDPDRPPTTPSALNDEYSSGTTLDSKWTTVNWTAPSVVNVNTTVPGALYMKCTSTGATLPSKMQPIPPGDFMIVMKGGVQSEAATGSNAGFGILLADGVTAGAGNQVILGSLTYNYFTTWLYTWTGYNSFSSNLFLRTEQARYLRIWRASGNYHWGTSWDGETWTDYAYNPAFTPTHFGVAGLGNQSAAAHITFKFFRYYDSATAIVGGLIEDTMA
ncbi:hypothetical protein [Geothrix sp. 21YS21S-2]|uniref:hypothetical protein n=1 Tax=Geothrix sp. 21YS21S-2 TaxID=3068893 RepID=UPI0027B88B39|nr:hypothetical protein [Geothrix sp. 21YS21S-2]